MKTALWLRRDFRLHDQTALYHACRASDEVIPLFVLDPAILEEFGGSSKPASYFFGALLELRGALQRKGKDIVLLRGDPLSVIPEFCRKNEISALFFNRDYEPYARKRDQEITELCVSKGIEVSSFKDHVLFEEDEILNGSGAPYRVFTPFRKRCLKELRTDPVKVLPLARLSSLMGSADLPRSTERWATLQKWVEQGIRETNGRMQVPGESAARKRLSRFMETHLREYKKMRDFPARPGVSRISPDLRNGALSPRQALQAAMETENAAKPQKEHFLSELLWRDFFIMVGFHFPHVFRGNFNARYDSIEWRNDETEFKAWCEGRTGYPIVDAGMRELVSTGFMHNRVRMIVASFLVKDLLIDWRWGEKFFLQHLIDGDQAINNGNWQWCASTGTDAQPYFRIFNPVSQSRRFDPRGEYIRTFLPERADSTDKSVHFPAAPIVDHETARMRALIAYRRAR